MADISLVCVRDDAWKAELLSGALERYGFTVCRSASVFEDFSAYSAVVVLLSPGAARSELVMATAGRALDWGKLIPVFVNLCHLPDRLAGVALHDLSAWDGHGEDPVVQAIAYHAQRLAGLPGRPGFGPDTSPRRLAAAPQPHAYFEPAYATAFDSYADAQTHHQPRYDIEANYGRGYGRRAPAYIAAHNELDYAPHSGGGNMRALDVQVSVSGNDSAAQRRAYFMDNSRHSFSAAPVGAYHSYEAEAETATQRRHRMLPNILTVMVSAIMLMGMAYVEEARTRELPHAVPAEATALLSAPTTVDTSGTPRQDLADAR